MAKVTQGLCFFVIDYSLAGPMDFYLIRRLNSFQRRRTEVGGKTEFDLACQGHTGRSDVANPNSEDSRSSHVFEFEN